ncbi:hypothetical protein BD769DRAFT_1676174 [Suillus cothurnatus]|nr:hypothetical protein BD769DRAFT_1676174 [Suillus cothurnatus]
MAHLLISVLTTHLYLWQEGLGYCTPSQSIHKGKSFCKWVVFIWSIHGAEHIQWIDEALIKAVQLAPPSLTVSICIFDTGSPSMSQSMEEDSSPSIPIEKNGTPEQDVANGSLTLSKLLLLGGVKMENGRANLDALLKEEISMALGSVSVSGKH